MEGKNSSEKPPSIWCTKSRGVTSTLLSITLTNGPRVRRLVLAEKFSAARRLAQILSEEDGEGPGRRHYLFPILETGGRVHPFPAPRACRGDRLPGGRPGLEID